MAKKKDHLNKKYYQRETKKKKERFVRPLLEVSPLSYVTGYTWNGKKKNTTI